MQTHQGADTYPTVEPDVVTGGHEDRFLKIVNHLSRQNVNMCWHCLACGGGCPFSSHMDLLPNQVIRLVQLGSGEEALRCRTIWLCVGCHTCSSQCPNSIDVAAVMDALRQLAIRNGIAAPEMDIFRFHKYVYGSIARHGRLNKLEAMVQFKVLSGRIFSDLQSGLKMITRGKLELLSQTVADRDEVDRIFAHYDRRRRSFDTHE
ncbi:4Fe-4S dicluster domain-containing protein [Desulfosarcina sp.]|uniref:4Fe-4S dicluster domain-containing protein n=1 Tax=Desulfosarcina sp. TaxID=2027861 RepID=UPI0039711765